MSGKEATEAAMSLKENWKKIKSTIEDCLDSRSLELVKLEVTNPLEKLTVVIKDGDDEEKPPMDLIGLSLLSREDFEKDMNAFLELFEVREASLDDINSDSDIKIEEPLSPRLLLKSRKVREFREKLVEQIHNQLSRRGADVLFARFLDLEVYSIPEEYPMPYMKIDLILDLDENQAQKIKEKAMQKLDQSTRNDLNDFQERYEEYLKMVSCECGQLYSLGHKGEICENCGTKVSFRDDK